MSGLELERQDLAILETQDEATLARWWCELNRWAWPEALPKRLNDRTRSIMYWIHNRIGKTACLREWNRKHTKTGGAAQIKELEAENELLLNQINIIRCTLMMEPHEAKAAAAAISPPPDTE